MGREEVSDIELFMNFTDRFAATRLWEIRVAQIPFSQRAPSGCLQYFTSPNGIIQVNRIAISLYHLVPALTHLFTNHSTDIQFC